MPGFKSLLLILCCASLAIAQTYPTTIPATQPAVTVEKDQILVQFEPMDCPCYLSDVNAALMELTGVSSVKWDYDHDRVFMQFLDDRRPTDEEITRAIRPTPMQLKKIQRP